MLSINLIVPAQGILLFFVDFDSEFLQAFLLHILQVLQDVFEILLCIVAQLTPTHSQRNRGISRDESYQHLVIYSPAELIKAKNLQRCFHRTDRQLQWGHSVFCYTNQWKEENIHNHIFSPGHSHLCTHCWGIYHPWCRQSSQSVPELLGP